MFGFWKGTKAKLLPPTGIEFSDGRFYTYGAGSPEGVVTATVGSFYSDTTNGYIYTKNSGAGNTGWAQSVTLTEMATGSMSAPGLPFVGDPNTGIFQPNVNRLGITTDGQERFMVDENGRLYNVYDGDVGTNYRTTLHAGWVCRTWVKFNGTLTGTNAPVASGNVVTVERTDVGQYSINFLVSFPDANYCPVSIGHIAGGSVAIMTFVSATSGQLLVRSRDATGADIDIPMGHVAIFR